MKVAVVGYRDWANRLFSQISLFMPRWDVGLLYTEEPPPPTEFDLVFFVGWSEIIPEEYFTAVPCYVLHPSKLPLYRGGSPIQHQMIAGETMSAVTIFRLLPGYGIDAGPIAIQKPYRIGRKAYLPQVLREITFTGAKAIAQILNGIEKPEDIETVEQEPVPEGHPALWKRRTPEESEIVVRLDNALVRPTTPPRYSGEELERLVRALQPPYPEAFIRVPGGRLVLEKVRYEDE